MYFTSSQFGGRNVSNELSGLTTSCASAKLDF
jgi:hypothetical protein